jgi:hypothetical protein
MKIQSLVRDTCGWRAIIETGGPWNPRTEVVCYRMDGYPWKCLWIDDIQTDGDVAADSDAIRLLDQAVLAAVAGRTSGVTPAERDSLIGG